MTWEIGESAVRLIDAIAYPDFVVGSALGHSDGQVYQRLLDAIESAKGVYDMPSWFPLLKQLRSSYISAVVPPCLSHNQSLFLYIAKMSDSLRLHLRQVHVTECKLDKGFIVIRGETVCTSAVFQFDSQGCATIAQDFGDL